MKSAVFATPITDTYLKTRPFPHGTLPNFLDDVSYQSVLEAIQQEAFFEKEADLFHFMQTNELNNSKVPAIKAFKELLLANKIWFEKTTEVKLNGSMDMQGSCYGDTHFLLCHDDQLDERKIAFIYYLSTLKKEDGGALRLYYNNKGEPLSERYIDIQPQANTLVFFTVSPTSFHEVMEVITKTDRLALGGWLH